MIINVIGLGYIGLPTALSLAAAGCEVVGTDVNQKLLDTLLNGKTTFLEAGMEELLADALKKGIQFSPAPVRADIYIIAVPTPYDSFSKKIDPAFVCRAVGGVLPVCPADAVIAVESTVSPGTMERVIRPLIQDSGFVCGTDLHIAHVPERIIPGNMLDELKRNNRTIGVDDRRIGERLRGVYASFCQGELIVTSIKVAEMTKVIENTFRDVNIAFANELSRICNREQIDVYEVIEIANMHPRVNILSPGPGVGGHCISVDPWFLVGDYPDIVNVILSSRHVNSAQPEYILSRVHELMKRRGIADLAQVGFYGVTYKENVDDTRESPTLQLFECMEKHLAFGAKFYDPYLKQSVLPNQCMGFEEFLDAVELVVVMVAHDQIVEREGALQAKAVFDTKNCLNGPNIVRL